ncbi:MAG: polyphenol oxidase family protein [Verrucomicrobiales bacterium]
MTSQEFLQPLTSHPPFRAGFVERMDAPPSRDKDEALQALAPAHQAAWRASGFTRCYHAEQSHGCEIAHITEDSPALTPVVDGMMSDLVHVALGIHVADCGALYLIDPVGGAFALLHSGKKGTELNITGQAVAKMTETFGTRPADLIAVLGPCIRPPHYEIDFAARIRAQALEAGIAAENYHDAGLCTASDLDRYYSYRLEKGLTGRHLAFLGKVG